VAAVAVGFARFAGVFWPEISEDRYLVDPIRVGNYALSLSTAQLVGVLMIALLTWTNMRGLQYGKWVQNLFTVAKTGALFGLIVLYLLANVAYLVTLPLHDPNPDAVSIQNPPAPADRVGTATLARIFPAVAVPLMAGAIMVSTFGCNNGLILSGARVYYAMAR